VGRFLKGGGPQAAPKPLLAHAPAYGAARGATGENRHDLRPLPRGAPARPAGRARDQHR
jgi:hypothetical protein